MPTLFAKYPLVLSQFMLGPRGSGAPPHFHGHAINMLIRGAKKWVLFPPRDAFFTISHGTNLYFVVVVVVVVVV